MILLLLLFLHLNANLVHISTLIITMNYSDFIITHYDIIIISLLHQFQIIISLLSRHNYTSGNNG